MTVLQWCLLSSGLGLWLVTILSRSTFLAPYRIGWLFYLANVFFELSEKRMGFSRWLFEACLVCLAGLSVGLASSTYGASALLIAVHFALIQYNLLSERAIVTATWAIPETEGLRAKTRGSNRYPSPGLHPNLSLNLEGPFVARTPNYDLGFLTQNQPFRIGLLVGNPCRVTCQAGADIELTLPKGWYVDREQNCNLPPIQSGEVIRIEWRITPTQSVSHERIQVTVRSGRFHGELSIACSGCIKAERFADIDNASISRYPGARRASFSLRGDFDLYDKASFQSIQGLEDAFGLSARYCLAQTMYLSTRLSLDQCEAERWARHYHFDRGATEIPAFVQWMQEKVDFRHSAPYPVQSDKPYVIELGNHGHLHYDTDASGAEGNGWKAGAKPGEGHYPWQGEDHSSFGDQRDNILEAARWCSKLFGFVPLSWAKPGRGNDQYSPAAVEAAGCEVATGSDIGPMDNVLRQPPPHHPRGTRIAELTARYPSDPQHILHAMMLEFWMHRAYRLGIPMVILVHQHMRQFDGPLCARLTEYLLNRAVNGFNGDFYLDTVYGVGSYWREVLSPLTRRVAVSLDGDGVRVANRSDKRFIGLPVDIRLKSGERMTRLVDIEPGQMVVLS